MVGRDVPIAPQSCCRTLAVLVALCAATTPSPSRAADTPTIALSDDALSLVVTVPAGCQTGMKLELAYDGTSIDAASKFYISGNGTNRTDWASATNLTDSVPAAGAEYTVALADLGVAPDASFRLFASNADYTLLDFIDQEDTDSDHDTGIKDSECNGIEFGCYTKAFFSGKTYPAVIGSRSPDKQTGFNLQHSGKTTGAYLMQYVDKKYTGRLLTLYDSKINTCIFTNAVLLFNGTSYIPNYTGGATRWTTPLGESGLDICMGRYATQDALQGQFRWYYFRLYGTDDEILLDYVPAKRTSDGVAGFFDRATATFVTPSGGGAFSSSSSTDSGNAVSYPVSGLVSFNRLAKNAAAASIERAGTTNLTISVRAGYGTGAKLVLAHDTANMGDSITNWSGMIEVASSIPAAGGTYTVDLAANGLASGRIFRAFIADRYTLLERVQQDSSDDWIDTGIRDTHCHGLEFGYLCTGGTQVWAAFLASGNGDTNPGFRFCLNGSYSTFILTQNANGNKYTYNTKDSFVSGVCNVFSFENDALTFNGTDKPVTTPSGGKWRTSPAGLNGRTIGLGYLPGAATAYYVYGWWYYLKMKDADGNLVLDYFPVKNSSGTAGFLDRATGRFVVPASGALVAGDEVAAEAYIGVAVTDAMTCDETLPVTATWIGGADGAIGDTSCWACTNALGAALADTLPLAGITEVALCGEVPFSISASATIPWRTASLRDCSPAADGLDWSGLGDGFALDGTLDLAGYSLTLAGVPSGGTITNSASGDPAALHVAIPADTVCENAGCVIGGNIRLYKEGEGTLVASVYPQTYSGGTDIVGGTLKVGVPGNINRTEYGSYFGSLLTIDVREDGTLDSGGTYNWGHHTVNLHGGTLTSSVDPASYVFNPAVVLTADSSYRVTGSCDLTSDSLDLGGHALNVTFSDNAWMIFSAAATNGSVVATGNGVFNLYVGSGSAKIACPGVVFDISTQINAQCNDITLGSLVLRCPENGVMSGTSIIKVQDVFKPLTEYFPNVRLLNGATLDLSETDGTFAAESLTSGRSLSFAADATVTVAVGARASMPSRLVSWTSAPSGADTLAVRCDNPKTPLEIRSDGIYRRCGMMLIFR